MEKVPFWTIYSYWSFAMTLLWLTGHLPFSPLVSAIVAFIGSSFLLRNFNNATLFIIATHIWPVWVLRNSPIDVAPNLKVFILYNLFLFTLETNVVEVYTKIFTDPPKTIKEYLGQRFSV